MDTFFLSFVSFLLFWWCPKIEILRWKYTPPFPYFIGGWGGGVLRQPSQICLVSFLVSFVTTLVSSWLESRPEQYTLFLAWRSVQTHHEMNNRLPKNYWIHLGKIIYEKLIDLFSRFLISCVVACNLASIKSVLIQRCHFLSWKTVCWRYVQYKYEFELWISSSFISSLLHS